MLTGRRTVTSTAAKIFVTPTDERSDVGIQIFAGSGNTADVYVSSNSAITANVDDDTDGYPLAANDKILITERDPNDLYMISPTGSQTIWFVVQ